MTCIVTTFCRVPPRCDMDHHNILQGLLPLAVICIVITLHRVNSARDCPGILGYLHHHGAAPTLSVLAINCRHHDLWCLPSGAFTVISTYIPSVKYVGREPTAMVKLALEVALHKIVLQRWCGGRKCRFFGHLAPVYILAPLLLPPPPRPPPQPCLPTRLPRPLRSAPSLFGVCTTILVRTGGSSSSITFVSSTTYTGTIATTFVCVIIATPLSWYGPGVLLAETNGYCLCLDPVGRGKDGPSSLSCSGREGGGRRFIVFVFCGFYTQDVSSSHSFFHHVSSFFVAAAQLFWCRSGVLLLHLRFCHPLALPSTLSFAS